MPARLCEGGQSFFVRLRNAAGLDVARIHYIACPDGNLLRWPSALLLGEVTLYRVAHD
ncbi:MAG: hypothetical protein K1X87_08555 [Dehalococcoidia bacterium]|nr:hypothetical protein [Dehalococcoidia bacterium]